MDERFSSPMEGVGADVSQKIRCAIKAKLVELGAYVDDELPDYIMVMVANKKSKAQMTEDLALFLGNHTKKFTDWLHDVLERLQSVTSDVKKKSSAKLRITPDKLNDIGVASKKTDSASVNSRIAKHLGPSESDLKLADPDEAENQEEILAIKAEADDLLAEELQEDISSSKEMVTSIKKHYVTPVQRSTSTETSKPLKKVINLKEESRFSLKRPAAANIVQPIPQKRRAPSSTVGAVVYHSTPIEDDDSYPIKSGIASVVKVSERRSSIPPSLQANKALILRAMEEAKNSVIAAAATKRETGKVEPYQPLPIRELFTKKYKTSKVATLSAMPVRTSTIEPMELDEDENLFEESYEEMAVSSPALNISADENILTLPCRKYVLIDSDDNILDNSNLLELNDGTQRIIVQESLKEDSRSQSPKFVVTLDGINPEMFKKGNAPVLKGARSSEHGGILVNSPIKMSLSESEAESEDDVFSESRKRPIAMKKKIAERCKYWPACKSGDMCPYHHPITQCKTFPNCKYGDKCLYIHPNCKFDASCTKRNCPFTHASKRILATPTLPANSSFPSNPKDTTCRFYPHCTNLNCHFYHPKPCRYGLSCSQPDCTFLHPPLPSRDKLKWTAPQIS